MKALRRGLVLFAATFLLGMALLGALWIWGGASSSLALVLDQLRSYLPPGQTLEVKEVEGSLRGGGHIGWLRWQQGALSVEARDVRVAWGWRPLLNGELRLSQLAMRHLRIDDRRPPSPRTAPTELRLPLKVDTPFSVETVEWVGPPALQITGLAGKYVFDSKEHRLDVSYMHISSGTYRVQGRLQAQAPMALSVQVDGSVQTAVPSRRQTLTVQAHAELRGALAGPDATLALQAQLLPTLNTAPNRAMQASITASLQPWQPQLVTRASARWQALDLAALWPQAPQTQLGGDASVTPAGPGWRGELQVNNTLPGPWNQQRLPLDRLNAKVVFAQGQWAVESLQASGAGGRVTAQGRLNSKQTAPLAGWQGSATLHGINPAAVDTRLAATVLDGQLTAQQAASGIRFEARMQTAGNARAAPKTGSRAPGARALAGLRLKNIQAKGVWLAPLLTLETLQLDTDDAQLQGRLRFNTQSQATAGELALTLPGARATVAGHIASSQGQGELNLRVADAALAARWLARWPDLAAALGPTTLQGDADLSGRWQGGWQQQGQQLQIQASLRAARLDLHSATQPPDQDWRLRDLQAELNGTLRALTLTTRAQADQASRHFVWQAQAHGGRLNDGDWQAQLDAAQLTAQDSLRPGNWTLALNDSVRLNWKHNATTLALEASAGSARLTGPVPGVATVSWQAAHWSQQLTQGKEQSQWQTQGSLQGLPLAWLDLLGQTQMANLGLRGDLSFAGQWDAKGGDTLQLRASLARTGGDLQLQTEEAGLVRAGVREARLLITAEGEQLAASLQWDSERAGQVQADVSTRLQRLGGAWTWPMDAPLAGSVRAQLPPVGAWSLLAPPGWRLRGTLDADAVLSGTRGTPQWVGSLRAQDMAVRSVADGIDFSQGTLRARLQGERMDITEFTLQGAGGSTGGRLSIQGAVEWLPGGPAATTASRLRMALEAQVQALRVSTRADRRLVVSGQLTAQLKDARLAIRGALKADQALFILPEDATPQLGDDVIVRRVAPGQSPATPVPTVPGVRVTPDVELTLDLGPDFEVRGRGLLTRLAGNLTLRSTPERKLSPRLTGELRTVRGSYKAYGQQLAIEEGVLRFNGPYDNPVLDILAIRPNLQQRVGVQISGTALSPLVRLYAEPDLPDADKLAWLILGHSAAQGGAEAAVLQQAALALLGGKGGGLSGGLAQALGLDELSMRSGANNPDGSTTGATVTLGKRVSRDFYVAYERSLAGTLGTFYIFYDLSRRFTLRAQTGAQSAVDLIFTLRYD